MRLRGEAFREHLRVFHGHGPTLSHHGGLAWAASPIRTTRPARHCSVSSQSIGPQCTCASSLSADSPELEGRNRRSVRATAAEPCTGSWVRGWVTLRIHKCGRRRLDTDRRSIPHRARTEPHHDREARPPRRCATPSAPHRSARPSEGVLRLGVPEDFAASQLTKLLLEFARSRPGLRLDVRCRLSVEIQRALVVTFVRIRSRLVAFIRSANGPPFRVSAYCSCLSRNLLHQLARARAREAALRHRRRFPKQLVSGALHDGRGLAQQPSCVLKQRQARLQVVGDRSYLLHLEGAIVGLGSCRT
jgi:hypothetical protein